MGLNKPILCVDFDGVVHSYEHGWQEGVIYGTATPGFWDWLRVANEHFSVYIYSSRSKTREGIAAMERWWESQPGCVSSASVKFASEKPPAFLTIDDRALTFDGDWSKFDPVALRQFKPWNAAK